MTITTKNGLRLDVEGLTTHGNGLFEPVVFDSCERLVIDGQMEFASAREAFEALPEPMWDDVLEALQRAALEKHESEMRERKEHARWASYQ